MSSPTTSALPRLAGIALPLFSLRAADDLGSGTILDLIPFVDWCAHWHVRLVQLLPINEAAPAEASPYKAISAFAIDPSYVSVLQIPEIATSAATLQWLASSKVQERARHLQTTRRRERKRSYGIKVRLLEFAFAELERNPDATRATAFAAFCRQQATWLEEYALFRALSERQSFRDWEIWPAELRDYESARRSDAAVQLQHRVRFAKYVQWVAHEQWQQAHAHARRAGVLLKGDMAFVCAANSADVWAHPELFDVRSSAGTPPDAFSASGQLWELPVYNWEALRRSNYEWWRRRARQAGELYDVFRVDHVVGLYRTYAIPVREGGPAGFVPSDEATQRSQGHELMRALQSEAGAAVVVAEDLGTVPDWVRHSLHELGIPGYKVFRWEQRDGNFIDPRTYPEASIATTGTHDTDTLAEWWGALSDHERAAVYRLLQTEPSSEHSPEPRAPSPQPHFPQRAIIQRLLESPASMVILPLQDVLGWTDRINVPATIGAHNWSYRLPVTTERFDHDPEIAAAMQSLREMIDATGRAS